MAEEDAPESQPDSVLQLNTSLAPSTSFLSLDINCGKMSHVMVNPHKFAKEPKKNIRHELNISSTFISPQIMSSLLHMLT